MNCRCFYHVDAIKISSQTNFTQIRISVLFQSHSLVSRNKNSIWTTNELNEIAGQNEILVNEYFELEVSWNRIKCFWPSKPWTHLFSHQFALTNEISWWIFLSCPKTIQMFVFNIHKNVYRTTPGIQFRLVGADLKGRDLWEVHINNTRFFSSHFEYHLHFMRIFFRLFFARKIAKTNH